MALTPPQLIANRQSMQIYGGGDTNIEKAQSKEKQNKNVRLCEESSTFDRQDSRLAPDQKICACHKQCWGEPH